jgi:hypothetical protein
MISVTLDIWEIFESLVIFKGHLVKIHFSSFVHKI